MGEAQSFYPSCSEETAEVIVSSDQDEIFYAGLTGEDTLWQTQNLLEGLLIPASLETPRDPPGGTGDVADCAPVATRTWIIGQN